MQTLYTVLEALAVIVGAHVFAMQCREAYLTIFVDNQGVLHSFIGGSSRQPETNLMIAQFWLHMAALGCEVRFVRVESHANIADGPTRSCLTWLEMLGARELSVSWPLWLRDVWAPPGYFVAWT